MEDGWWQFKDLSDVFRTNTVRYCIDLTVLLAKLLQISYESKKLVSPLHSGEHNLPLKPSYKVCVVYYVSIFSKFIKFYSFSMSYRDVSKNHTGRN